MPKSNAETAEKKNYASSKQVAALLKVTEYDVKRFVRFGMPKHSTNKFNSVDCISWYIDYLRYWKERGTIEELAQMLGITPRWLNRLVVEKGIAKEKHGVYKITATVNSYVGFLKDQIRKAEEGESTLTDERRRLLRMQADLRHMELVEKQQKLIPVAVIQNIILEFVILTGKKLDSIPGVCLNKLFASKTKEEMLKVLRDTIHHIKNEISRAQSNIKFSANDSAGRTGENSSGNLGEGTGADKTKTRNKRKRVG